MNNFKQMANAIRFLSVDAIEKAASGHPGMPMGMADIITVLYANFLKFNPQDPNWLGRDKLVVSNGHGSMLLYSVLYLCGYDLSIEDIKNFRQLNSKTPGHPEFKHTVGVETTTGPLGQGIANAVGMAVANKKLQSQYGKELFGNKVYCLAGDGCLMEGISHEACSLAGSLKLDNLVMIFDDNNITIDGKADLTDKTDHRKRFESYNWHYVEINGHDYEQINAALAESQTINKPMIIATKTIIGYGAEKKANSSAAHGAPLGKEEINKMRENLNWNLAEFEIDKKTLQEWRNIEQKNHIFYQKWQEKFANFSNSQEPDLKELFKKIKSHFIEKQYSDATRKSSQELLKFLIPSNEKLIGGSADLTTSNGTKVSFHKDITADDFKGNYINYGVREHAMAAIMNGLALSGFIPYGGTFLVFSDYMRPAIRLAALMQQKVIYILTHDSIGLGEDGPTHQPIEHLASLRAMPGLNVMRPADAIEVAEAWEIALKLQMPSVIALSRQAMPLLRNNYDDNLSDKGAYVFLEQVEAEISLFASGSELGIAIEVAQLLKSEKNIKSRVISVPSMELFWQQDEKYITDILCNKTLKVAIEAACSQPWYKFIGPHGLFFGLDEFGASAQIKDLYNYFGLDVNNIANKIIKNIKKLT
jgi:transketolase